MDLFGDISFMKSKLLTKDNEWTFDLIDKAWPIIHKLAGNYGWEGYIPQFEVVSSEQMLDAYSSIGLPVLYTHWSFGKDFLANKEQYEKGRMGLAYELVINTNPSICYLLEDNTAMMMLLTMSHAAVGHSHFFRNNYLFKENTNADFIVDYLIYAKKFIKTCEEKYGAQQVEELLDCCHSLKDFGVDKYKRKYRSKAEDQKIKEEIQAYKDQNYNQVLDKTLEFAKGKKKEKKAFQSEENLLYFLEKNSLCLKPWQKEIVRIVRKVAQYFYPQMQTKLMNEGFASFVHYTLMNDLHEKGYMNEGFMLEFLHSHTSVCCPNHGVGQPYLNPYSLGFAMFKDIKRICQEPTEEDKKWFPDIAGTDWVKTINYIVANYKDESFISQFLSPKLMRDFKMFAMSHSNGVYNSEVWGEIPSVILECVGIHNDEDYKTIRQKLSEQYNLVRHIPVIEITNVDRLKRVLHLTHYSHDGNLLDGKRAYNTLMRLARLWGFGVCLYTYDKNGKELASEQSLRNVYWNEEKQDLYPMKDL